MAFLGETYSLIDLRFYRQASLSAGRFTRALLIFTWYHHGDLRRALIDTALAMVTEEGTWNFTLREVARRAGVSHAAPYNHLADKTALLAEVAALGFQALIPHIRRCWALPRPTSNTESSTRPTIV